MQKAKKYFTEGLIQLTILLSLIGVRVDIDSYLSGSYPPLIEINLGPSSAYSQTPFHNLRDTLDGYTVHPKCPELDHFFASRRLLEEVRSLGSPRFPTQLSTWLVHQVSATDEAESGPSGSDGDGSGSHGSGVGDEHEHLSDGGPEVHQSTLEVGPCSSGACGSLTEEKDFHIKEEEEPTPVHQLAHSSSLETENVLEGIGVLTEPAGRPPPAIDFDQQWSSLLSLSVTDLNDLDSLVTDADITSAISQDVSLHDAMVSTAGASQRRQAPAVARQTAPLQLDSGGSWHWEASRGTAPGSAALPFATVCNLTGSESCQGVLGGCLDEAVFDHINQLGLEGLDPMDFQLMNCLQPEAPPALEDVDSDSGLSLESSSGGPVSPGASEMSSSSSSSSPSSGSYREDECGATGYSSDADSLPAKGLDEARSPFAPSESVWHDHSYSSAASFDRPPVAFPRKGVKEEPLSEDEEQRLQERDLSRDEQRARAMCIPFSVLQIVNMPVEEFLEVLDGHGFSADQVTLLRDIRRRGKNKLAAQNCRKRKLDAITGLQEEVDRLRAHKDRLLRDKFLTAKTMGAVGQQIKQLTRDVLARLRDESGRPLSPDRFTLQCGADGRVAVRPLRRPAVSTSTANKTDKRKKDKKQ